MQRQVRFFALKALILCVGLVPILSINSPLNAKEHESPDYVQYVNEITSSFSKQMNEEFGLECEGSGGSMPYDVEEISVQFVAFLNATVEQARELEVKATERLVQIVNAHEKIRPFLREYPFPSHRASVTISFENPKKTFSLSNKKKVALVFQAKNRIFYRAENLDNPYMFKEIKDELYEEALKIVRSNAEKI